MEFYIAYTGHEMNARKLLLDGRIVDAKSKENRKVNKTTGKMIDLYPPIQQSEYSGSVVKTQIQSFYNEPIYVVEEREGCSPPMLHNQSTGPDSSRILPYQEESFSKYRTESVQEFRFALSEQIRQQVFYTTFVRNIETSIESSVVMKAIKQLIRQQCWHL